MKLGNAGGNGRSVRKIFASAVEVLESRRLFAATMLSNGGGEGAIQLVVDSYGGFGLVPTGRPSQFTDFQVGGAGVVGRSYVYFAPAGRFLTDDVNGVVASNSVDAPVLGDVVFTTVSGQGAVSRFRLTGISPTGQAFDYDVELTQSLAAVGPTSYVRDVISGNLMAGNVTGATGGLQSEFLQEYRITNRLGTTVSLPLVRYFEGEDFGFAGVLADGGRTLIAEDVNSFGRFRVDGGEFVGGAIRDAGLDGVIALRGGLTSDLFGVEGGIDVLGDPETALAAFRSGQGFAQASQFSIGGRQTVVYRTLTVLGTGRLLQSDNALLSGSPVRKAGEFGFSGSVLNYDFPVLPSGALRPLTVTVNRLGGTRGVATVNLSVLGSSTTPSAAYSLSATSVVFSEGQSTADVTVTVNSALAGAEASQILISLSTTTAEAGLAGPSLVTVNVLPLAPVFSLTPTGVTPGSTLSGRQGDGTVGVTVYRRGLPNGPAAVLLRSEAGGGSYAEDVRVEFADGETEKVVALPVRTTDVGSGNVAVTLSLVSTTPPAGALASVVVGPTRALAVAIRDTLAPTVTGLTVLSSRNRITGVVLVFSEALKGPGDLTNYVLAQRTSEGAFGSGATRELPLVSLSYDAATMSVTLTPRRALALNTNYSVTTVAGGSLSDLAGNTLNQVPGVRANYSALFSQGNRASYVDRTGDRVKLRLNAGNFLLVRQPDGDSATLTLFGDSTRVGRLTGTVTSVRSSGGTTPRGTILAPSNVLVDLPASFV